MYTEVINYLNDFMPFKYHYSNLSLAKQIFKWGLFTIFSNDNYS